MEKLVTNLARIAAPLISGALLVLIALASSGCSGESVQQVDLTDPAARARADKTLRNKYPEMADPDFGKAQAPKKRRRR
jgi:hypothetical protein